MQFSPARFAELIERSDVSKMDIARRFAGDRDITRVQNALNRIRWYAKGYRRPTEATAAKLAEALGCQVEEFLEQENYRQRTNMFKLQSLADSSEAPDA